jgi:hypothetical protein
MVLPVSERLQGHLESADYEREVADAARRMRMRLRRRADPPGAAES